MCEFKWINEDLKTLCGHDLGAEQPKGFPLLLQITVYIKTCTRMKQVKIKRQFKQYDNIQYFTRKNETED